jgi:hypothetical protein
MASVPTQALRHPPPSSTVPHHHPALPVLEPPQLGCHKHPTLTAHLTDITTDEALVPDLLRGRGKSIGGDLDVGAEGSEQTIVTLKLLHHIYDGYQHACI